MKPIFLLDNFDSFTYNLVDQFRSLGHKVYVYRNSVSADSIIAKMKECAEKPILILSPGPGTPKEAGCLLELIGKCVGKFPMIGICLGHQAICEHYGAKVVPAGEIVHGKTSLLTHTGQDIFEGFHNPMPVARYHSLICTQIPSFLEVVAKCGDINMAVLNRRDHVIGFQFHPESVMTTDGAPLLAKSLEFASKPYIDTKSIISKIYAGEDITKQESYDLFNCIFAGEIDPIQLGSIITALKIKGEKPAEIAGAASSMLHVAKYFEQKRNFEVGEIVGTGGDGQSTINISSISAIIAATCGLHVAKHGNRSVSSKTGASDILKALGVNISMTPFTSFKCLKNLGVTFLFAPVYHSAMKFAAPVRSSLGVRTIFNVLGPLTNPSHPDYMVMGVYCKELVIPMAEVLRDNGMKHAYIVHGSGLDEIAVHGETYIAELKQDGTITTQTVTASDFGLKEYPLDAIRGGDPEENSMITLELLQGRGTDAQNSSVAANTAALLVLGGKAPDFKSGAKMAMDMIKSGKAYEKLQEFITLSKQED